MLPSRLMRVRVPVVFGAFVLSGLVSWGCSSDSDDAGEGLDTAGRGSGGTSSHAGKGGVIVSGGSSSTGGRPASGGAQGTGASSGSGTFDPDAACVADSRDSARAVVALYFMVDISGSMKCAVPEEDPNDPCEVDPGGNYSDVTRWTESSEALQSFFTSSASNGMWAGIGFFPADGSCDPDDYAEPVSEIALLPGAASALNAAIDDQGPNGQTPTVPSLQGALQHAREWSEQHPDHQPVVVYLTDGYPRGCGESTSNTIGNAADVARDAFSDSPSIRTYVLGVGPNLDDLNEIAEAGGTQQAFFVDTGADVTAQLGQALASIREDVVIDCTYTIPSPPPGQSFDPGRVNVRYTSGGSTTDIGFNPVQGACAEGWQYSADGTQIILCEETCDMVQADTGASLQVLFGCATQSVDDPR